MSLIATRLQNWRVEDPEFDRNMTRPCEYGALDFFIEQTNAPSSIINPNLRDRAFALRSVIPYRFLSLTMMRMYRCPMFAHVSLLIMRILLRCIPLHGLLTR